jgi:hypothetical protein
MESVPVDFSYNVIGAPESRFCPAKVYEYLVDEEKNQAKL